MKKVLSVLLAATVLCGALSVGVGAADRYDMSEEEFLDLITIIHQVDS